MSNYNRIVDDSDSNMENKKNTTKWEKVAYFGAGAAMGVILYPFLKKGWDIINPWAKETLNTTIGKAETIVEDASDVLAKAKSQHRKKEEGSR
jgi:hypothetical protein